MSLTYIREYYKVPVRRMMRVDIDGRTGVIVGSRGAYIRVRFDGEKKAISFHPKWNVKYLTEEL